MVLGKVVVAGVLDEGSEIVVVRKDLWEDLGFEVNRARLMLMQAANGLKEAMEGSAEFLELEVGGIKTWANTFIVPNAPFCLLLGRPWQQSVLMAKTEHEDGHVEITIHDPQDR